MAPQMDAMTEQDAGPEAVPGQTGMDAPSVDGATEGAPDSSGRLPFFTLSPKWQLILIGGIFIAINIMVMIAFVVALALRH